MTLSEYIDSCISFSVDTEDYGGLEPYQQYTATAACEWVESSDNASGGLDVSWAFHLSEETIRDRACEKFLDQLSASLEQGIDEEWDAEQWSAMARRFV